MIKCNITFFKPLLYFLVTSVPVNISENILKDHQVSEDQTPQVIMSPIQQKKRYDKKKKTKEKKGKDSGYVRLD